MVCTSRRKRSATHRHRDWNQVSCLTSETLNQAFLKNTSVWNCLSGVSTPKREGGIFFFKLKFKQLKIGKKNKNLLIKKKLPYFLLIKFNQCGVLQWGGRQFQILVNNIILFLIHGVKKNMDHFNSI